jgi:hypothetical protein
MEIKLNSEEAAILLETLSGDVSDLGMEIADTDRKDFRETLKRRKKVLMEILNKLGQAAA